MGWEAGPSCHPHIHALYSVRWPMSVEQYWYGNWQGNTALPGTNPASLPLCANKQLTEQLAAWLARYKNATSKGRRHSMQPILTSNSCRPVPHRRLRQTQTAVPTPRAIHFVVTRWPLLTRTLYPNSSTGRTAQSFNTLNYVVFVPGPLQISCQHNNPQSQTNKKQVWNAEERSGRFQ